MSVSKKCKFLVSYKEIFEENDIFFLVMEYCSGGDLEHQLNLGRVFTSEVLSILLFYFNLICQEIIKFIYDMGKALLTLEGEKIIHENIKGKKILIAGNGSFILGFFLFFFVFFVVVNI
jgi:serine/threonine protein kinase